MFRHHWQIWSKNILIIIIPSIRKKFQNCRDSLENVCGNFSLSYRQFRAMSTTTFPCVSMLKLRWNIIFSSLAQQIQRKIVNINQTRHLIILQVEHNFQGCEREQHRRRLVGLWIFVSRHMRTRRQQKSDVHVKWQQTKEEEKCFTSNACFGTIFPMSRSSFDFTFIKLVSTKKISFELHIFHFHIDDEKWKICMWRWMKQNRFVCRLTPLDFCFVLKLNF